MEVLALAFKAHLPPTEKLVLIALADCASDEKHNIYHSEEEITAKTGLIMGAIQQSFDRLQACGVLIPRAPGLYRVDVKVLHALTRKETP